MRRNAPGARHRHPPAAPTILPPSIELSATPLVRRTSGASPLPRPDKRASFFDQCVVVLMRHHSPVKRNAIFHSTPGRSRLVYCVEQCDVDVDGSNRENERRRRINVSLEITTFKCMHVRGVLEEGGGLVDIVSLSGPRRPAGCRGVGASAAGPRPGGRTRMWQHSPRQKSIPTPQQQRRRPGPPEMLSLRPTRRGLASERSGRDARAVDLVSGIGLPS